jgi:hypothetical protein
MLVIIADCLGYQESNIKNFMAKKGVMPKLALCRNFQ